MFPLLWSYVICIHILVTHSSAQAPNGKCFLTDSQGRTPTENGVPDYLGQCAPICQRVSTPTDPASVECKELEVNGNPFSYAPIATVTQYNQGALTVGQCVCNDPWVNFFGDIYTDAVVELGQWAEEYLAPIFDVLEKIVEDIAEVVAAAALTFLLPGVGEVADAALGAVMVSARVADFTEGAAGGLAKFTDSLGSMAKTFSKTPGGIEKAYNQAKALPDRLIYPPFKMPEGVKPYQSGKDDDPENGDPPGRGRPTHGPSREPSHRPSSHPPSSHPPSSHPQSSHHPPSHRSSESKTSSAAHCNNRRAGGKGANNCPEEHLTSVIRWKAQPTSTRPVKTLCDAALYPQACAHYYSAGVNGYKGIKTKITCDKHFPAEERNGKQWPSVKKWYKDHKAPWIQWIDPTQYRDSKAKNPNEENWVPDCDADEWPPAALLPLAAREDGDTYPQRVRYLDAGQNRGAGHLWLQFCAKQDGGDGNNRPTDWFDGQKFPHVTVDEKDCQSKYRMGHDRTRTYSSTCQEGIWTRALFDLEFGNWPTGVPGPANNWYLDDNKCWPSTIVPDDPGFALNTDDKWYNLPQNAAQRARREQYSEKPMVAWFKKVDAQRKSLLQHDSDGNPTQQRNFGPGGGWQRRLRNRQALQVLGNGFAIRDINSTRPLTPEEVRRDVQIRECSDDSCSEEQAELVDETYVVVPARRQQRAATIPRIVDATATTINQATTLVTRNHARLTVSPNLPKYTGSARVQ